MTRNGRSSGGDDAEISVVCPDCDAAIHVSLDAFVAGAEAPCPECGSTCDLEAVGDGLPKREVLLDRLPAEARTALGPTPSEFPSPG